MKFRGKTKDGQWVEGWYVESINEDTGTHEHFIIKDPQRRKTCGCIDSCGCECNAIAHTTEILPESLSMKTGVKDKNGIMIFGSIPLEDGMMSRGGDECSAVRKRKSILLEDSSDRNYEGKIVFLKGGFKLEWISENQNILHVRIGELHELEIIGNQLK